MRWREVCAVVDAEGCTGAELDPEVSGVQYDSRRVMPGDVFVAMRGETSDGNRFVDRAMARGAVAVVTDDEGTFERLYALPFAVAVVEHGRRALSEVASALFDAPQARLSLSAVTGTNGKTTTAFLLEQMLRSVGRRSVLIGTIETHVGEEIRASEHTTPESRDTLSLFAEGVRAGCTEAVMEFSSHALEQERVWGLPVDVAIFTNLTQDHLDYHGTMESYAEAKVRLFIGVGTPAPRVAVINADDPWASTIEAVFRGETLMAYGLAAACAYRADEIVYRSGETSFLLHTPTGSVAMRSPLSGRVNVYNLLAASCAALARGLTLDEVSAAGRELKQVPGRFQVVEASRAAPFSVVVDYAHTDDALRNLITLARELVKPGGGRVITLFGCGGDRDRTKRPKMGRAAGEGSDLVLVTSDNPRSEDPDVIIAEVLVGLQETGVACVVEPDRRAAIRAAIAAARPGDIVLLAGKGHEKQQIFTDGPVPFDDVAEAQHVLGQRFPEPNVHAELNAEGHNA